MGTLNPVAGAALRAFFATPRVILAPMAGITDAPFRRICRQYGAELAFTEMVSAKGLSYENARTEDLLALGPDEDRVSVQLFGHEPAVLAAEAAKVEAALAEKLFSLNINMGCPARKIVTKGDGSALMRDPALAAAIVRAAKGAVTVPVTVKFRRGYAMGRETCVDFARAMEEAGADAITVHGRFAEQLYRGQADWDCIARVKDAVTIPVVGNGDVTCGDDAVALLAQTGCDAVMVARAAEGFPWVFADIRTALHPFRDVDDPFAGPFTPPTVYQRMAQATEHARLACRIPGGAVRLRRLAMCYVAGIPGASAARSALCSCTSFDDFARVFRKVADHAS